MSHDGNFDPLDAGQEFCVGWKKNAVLVHFPKSIRTRWFESAMDPGPHNGVGPGGVGKAQSEKASSTVLRLSLLWHRHAIPLKSPATTSLS